MEEKQLSVKTARNIIDGCFRALMRDARKQGLVKREAIDDAFATYNIQLAGRESLEGVPAILVTFKAKPGYKPKRSPKNNLAECRLRGSDQCSIPNFQFSPDEN